MQAMTNSLTFDEVQERIQEEERGQWDARIRRGDVTLKDGKIVFPFDPLGEHCEALTPTSWATGQLCQKLGIPTAYFRKCPAVLQDIQANYWLRQPAGFKDSNVHPCGHENGVEAATADGRAHHTQEDGFDYLREEDSKEMNPNPARPAIENMQHEPWLLRARHGTLRGVLSRHYTPLDNGPLLHCLKPLWEARYRIDWFALSDDSLHLRVVDPQARHTALPQDDLMAGVHIANSEVGKRAVTVDAMVYRLVCSNGLIRLVKGKSLLYQRHIHLTSERFEMALTEAVGAAFNEAVAFLQQFGQSTQQRVMDMDGTIERLGTRWNLSRSLQEMVKHALRREHHSQQETVYGLANALTSTAQNLADDERYDLEVLAGHLVEHGLSLAQRPASRFPAVPRSLPPTSVHGRMAARQEDQGQLPGRKLPRAVVVGGDL